MQDFMKRKNALFYNILRYIFLLAQMLFVFFIFDFSGTVLTVHVNEMTMSKEIQSFNEKKISKNFFSKFFLIILFLDFA